MTSGIYLIFNKDTGQLYPGGSINIEDRIYNHIHTPNKGSYIDNAIQKHGWGKFDWLILEETEPDWKIIGEREKYWIAYYNAFKDPFHYNLTEGGEGISGYVIKLYEYTVIKAGVYNGKQRYCISNRDNKTIKVSINKEALDEIAEKLNNGLLTEDEAKLIDLNPFKYTVSKAGFNNGKQDFCICGRDNKIIKRSINKEALDEIAENLNNGLLTEEEARLIDLNPFKYTVAKYGFRNGKQNYTILNRDQNSIKVSINKEALDKIAVALNNGSLTEEEVKNNRGVDFL